MSLDRFKAVENLYHAALEIDPERRSAFVEEACAGDDYLRSEVQMLLSLDRQAGDFLEEPALEVVARQAAQKARDSLVGRHLGSYELLALAGSGGMGEVYRARDVILGRTAAIKILPERLRSEPGWKQRFRREARAAARLNHPNIAQVYEAGESGGVTYLAMEYVDGETLANRAGNPESQPENIISIAIQIATALKEAHSAGVIHRDVKPSNVMLTRRGNVKLLDFGIARFNVQPHQAVTGDTGNTCDTTPGMLMGTLRYMSPEQVLGHEFDHRTDIFSFGVLLYELATGKAPFTGSTSTEVMDQILHSAPASVKELAPATPRDLARIIHKCLKKDRDQRFQSGEELLAMLERLRGASQSDSNILLFDAVALLAGRNLRYLLLSLAVVAVVAMWRIPTWVGGPRLTPVVAVMPFANVLKDPELDYLAEGLTAGLIDDLARSRHIKVLARTTTLRYKDGTYTPPELGRQLNVNAIVMGNLTRQGENLQIEASMLTAAGNQLWNRRYIQPTLALNTVKDDVLRLVLIELGSRDTIDNAADRQPASSKVHSLYLQGRHHWNKYNEAGFRKSIEFFQQAIDLDPTYALAYSGLADSYYVLSTIYVPANVAMPKARAAAMRALQLDGSIAEAHATLAQIRAFYDWDWSGAEPEYKRAIELKPGYASAHHWYGIYLVSLERFAEARRELQNALALDPLSESVSLTATWPDFFERRYKDALRDVQHIVQLYPEFPQAYWLLGDIYAQQNEFSLAKAAYRRMLELENSPINLAASSYVHGTSGDEFTARRLLKELTSETRGNVPPSMIAEIYTSLNEKDNAFAWLRRAVEERDEFLSQLRINPRFNKLRQDVRFHDVLRQVGLAR